jgi:intein-encoded DNA endonuclease-like protein
MPISKNYDKDFFKTWSREMAYILGFMYADGNIVKTKRGNCYVAVYTADKNLLILMAKYMKSEHKIGERRSATGCVFRIQVGSREWFEDLDKLGLCPNKTKRIQLPSIPPAYFGDFVRGYFDGDGNVWVGLVHKNRQTALETIQLTFTSGSKEYLHALQLELKRQGIVGGSLFSSKNKQYARLTFSVKDALKIYRIMYNAPHKLYLKRKKTVFEQFIKRRK